MKAFQAPGSCRHSAQARRAAGTRAQRPVTCLALPKSSTYAAQHDAAAEAAPAISHVDRRSLLLGASASVALWQLTPQGAAKAEGEAAVAEPVAPVRPALYEDPSDRFVIQVPAGWARGEGELSGNSGFSGASGARRTIAFFPDDPSVRDVNISVVITNVSVEFTKLGSFGSIETFATNLINSLDRSYLLRSRLPVVDPIQIAELVDYKATSSAYNVEYTIQKLPEPQRHLFSTVVLGSNGRYNRLYTVTAQCLEQDLPKYEKELVAAVKSFKADLLPGI